MQWPYRRLEWLSCQFAVTYIPIQAENDIVIGAFIARMNPFHAFVNGPKLTVCSAPRVTFTSICFSIRPGAGLQNIGLQRDSLARCLQSKSRSSWLCANQRKTLRKANSTRFAKTRAFRVGTAPVRFFAAGNIANRRIVCNAFPHFPSAHSRRLRMLGKQPQPAAGLAQAKNADAPARCDLRPAAEAAVAHPTALASHRVRSCARPISASCALAGYN